MVMLRLLNHYLLLLLLLILLPSLSRHVTRHVTSLRAQVLLLTVVSAPPPVGAVCAAQHEGLAAAVPFAHTLPPHWPSLQQQHLPRRTLLLRQASRLRLLRRCRRVPQQGYPDHRRRYPVRARFH
jgi:hypothetical protein